MSLLFGWTTGFAEGDAEITRVCCVVRYELVQIFKYIWDIDVAPLERNKAAKDQRVLHVGGRDSRYRRTAA